MLFTFCDSMAFAKTYTDFIGENYTDAQLKAIFNEPVKWLNSLPMTEYAHVLTCVCAHHLGGEPTQYIKILYNGMLNPILSRYYKELEWYRFMRATYLRKYYSMRKYAPQKSHVNMKCKLGMCTARTKRAIRFFCEQYTYLKDLGANNIKVKMWCKEAEDLATKFNPLEWNDELERFKQAMDVMDFDAFISHVDEEASNKVIAAKLNTLCDMFDVPKVDAETPVYADVRATLNLVIDAFNLDHMDGSTSYKKLAKKINELIDCINNQKIPSTVG